MPSPQTSVAGVSIRPATLQQRDALVRLRAELWPEQAETDAQAVDALLAGTPDYARPLVDLLAFHGETVCGFIEVGLRSHGRGADPRWECGFVEGWFVDEMYRRQGIGRELMDAARRWALEQGAHDLGSNALLFNELSLNAHLALGFELVSRSACYRKTLNSSVNQKTTSPCVVKHFDASVLQQTEELRQRLWPQQKAAQRLLLPGLLNNLAPSTLPVAVLVAHLAGVPVGFVEVGLRSYAEGCDSSPLGYVQGWFVAEEARGQGVGRALIYAADRWTLAQGCTEMASDTEVENSASRAALLSVGFEFEEAVFEFGDLRFGSA